jgi:hypothetical protein
MAIGKILEGPSELSYSRDPPLLPTEEDRIGGRDGDIAIPVGAPGRITRLDEGVPIGFMGPCSRRPAKKPVSGSSYLGS